MKFQAISQTRRTFIHLEAGISEIQGDIKIKKARALKFDKQLEALKVIIVYFP